MPRSKSQVAEERLIRHKDASRRLEAMRREEVLAASREMLILHDLFVAGHGGMSRNRLASLWKTSMSQVDVMLARARHERDGKVN